MKSGLESDVALVDIGHGWYHDAFFDSLFFYNRKPRKNLNWFPAYARTSNRYIGRCVANSLERDITYLKNEGYPPLLIKGKKLSADEVCLSADISSQYITALMLIAPHLCSGLRLHLQGKITLSSLHKDMTQSLLHDIGIEA